MSDSGSDTPEWRLVERVAYPDEVELSYVAVVGGGRLNAQVRVKTSGGDWRLRVVLDNDVSGPLTLGGAPLILDWQPGTPAPWCWAAGAAGVLLLPSPGPGPMVLRLTQGTLTEGTLTETLTEGTLTAEEPGPLWIVPGTQLPAGRRLVFELAGSTAASWQDAAGAFPAWLPQLLLTAGDVCEFASPDAAVSAPTADVAEVEGVTLIRARPGHHDVLVSGSRGEVRLDLDVAPGDPAVVSGAAAALVGSSLPDDADAVAAWLLVCQAAVRSGADDDVHDLADRLGGRLLEAVETGVAASPRILGALLGETPRTSESHPARALRRLAGSASRGVWLVDEQDVMARLGGGLPGHGLDPVATARAVAEAALVAESGSGGRRDWPMSIAQAGEHARRRLVVHHATPDVISWLLLSS